MCGRYSLTTPNEAMTRLFGLSAPAAFPGHHNIAPTNVVPVVRASREAEREAVLLRWGLVPSWSQGPDNRYRMINARAETVATKPAFRAAFKARRCLVPAEAFYEWRKTSNGKQPYRIGMADGAPFAFAGLWERWQPPEGDAMETFTIIVTDANDLVRPLHDRMPVIVDPADYDLWLAPTVSDRHVLDPLLRPHPPEAMAAEPVDPRSLRIQPGRHMLG